VDVDYRNTQGPTIVGWCNAHAEATIQNPPKPNFWLSSAVHSLVTVYSNILTYYLFISQCITHNSIRAGNSGWQLYYPRQFRKFQSSNPTSYPSTNTHQHVSTPLDQHTFDPVDNDTPASNSHEAKATAFTEPIARSWKQQQSKPKLREPDPFDGSNSQKTSHFHPTVHTQLPRSQRYVWGWYQKGQLCPLLSESTALDCFNLPSWIHIKPQWLVGFQPIRWRTRSQLWTLWSVREAEAKLEGTSHAWKATRLQVLYQVPAASWCIHGAMQHSTDRLTTDSPNVSKMTWPTMISQTPFRPPETHPKLIWCQRYWEWHGEVSQWNLMLPRTFWNKTEQESLTLLSLTTSPAKVLHSPSRRTITRALPRQGINFQTERSPHSYLSSNSGRQKANSTGTSSGPRSWQQALPLLWHRWNVAKDCPKIQLSFCQQPEHPNLIRKSLLFQHRVENDWAVLKTLNNQRIAWTPSLKTLLSMHPLFHPDSVTLSWHLTPSWIWSLKVLMDPDLQNSSLFCVCSDSASPAICYVRNTPVTLLTNFWLVSGSHCHSITISEIPGTMFALKLGDAPPVHLPWPLLAALPITEFSTPDPISFYGLSLTSCFCLTLLSCVSHSYVTSHSCVLFHTSIPPTMLCSLVLV